MNTANEVKDKIQGWIDGELTKAEIVWNTALACLGWPYVFGAVGELCTPANRKKYYNSFINRKPDEAKRIKERCQVMNGKKSSCEGCTYYPGGAVRCFDCRGFTRWVLAQVGITLNGAGATSQWNNNANWSQKGRIEDLPDGVLACFFHANGSTMEHTGFCLNGITVHCSGTVKKGKTTDKGITHYAVPKGLDGQMPVSKPTLRKGDRGEYVTLAQTELIAKGFSCGTKGADGIFGSATETAVKRLQGAYGLTVDGIIGQKTWAVLDSSEPVKTYTVTIHGLTSSQADDLKAQYPTAIITGE